MKKVITWILVACIVLVGVAVVLNINNKQPKVEGRPANDTLVKGKFFGMDLYLTDFVQINDNIKAEALIYKTADPISSTVEIFNTFTSELNYVYTTDKVEIYNNGILIIKEGADTWLPAPMTLKMLQEFRIFHGDCEDGTYYIVAMLRALGLEAYANVGVLTLDEGIYGHAWVTVILNGKEILFETTGGNVTELITIEQAELLAKEKGHTLSYSANVQFNESKINYLTKIDINRPMPAPLPLSKVNILKTILHGD